MISSKSVSNIVSPRLPVQSAVALSANHNSEGRKLRRFQVLPPVGAHIPYSSILAALWDSVQGNAVRGNETLPHRLTELTGLEHWIFTNSGRAALSSVVMALHARRPERDEVIVPAYTSYSVPAAIIRAGLKVRLCDIEADTLGLDPTVLSQCITPRTLCVVPHHLYGLPCRMTAVSEIVRAHRLPLIEDAAQGMGIICEGRAGGAQGDAGIFSLSRGKNLPGAGGGVIGTNDPEMAEACRRFVRCSSRTLGLQVREAVETSMMAVFIRPSLYWLPARLPFLKLGHSWFEPAFEVSRMSDFQCAIFSRLLPNLKVLQPLRREQAFRLRHALDGLPVRFLWPREGDEGAFLRAPVLMPDRFTKERVLSELRHRGLGATEGYPLALSQLAALRPSLAAFGGCPTAEWISERLITLPTHHWVTDSHRQAIADVVNACT